MTFNDTCISIENYTGDAIDNINNVLSNVYAIESYFNMNIAFALEGETTESFGQKLKTKIQSIGKWISGVFKRIGKFFSDIFKSITGDKIAYNSNLVKKQCKFIDKCAQKIISETENEIYGVHESALFIVMEAKFKDENKLSFNDKLKAKQMTMEREKAEKRNKKAQISLAERVERSKEIAKTISEKFNLKDVNYNEISLNMDTKADISVKEASKNYNDTYDKCARDITIAFNALRKTASEKNKKSIKKATSLIKRISKFMALNSAIIELMRSSKIR